MIVWRFDPIAFMACVVAVLAAIDARRSRRAVRQVEKDRGKAAAGWWQEHEEGR